MDCALAPAKINLALHVGLPLANGYHPVDTLCAFVDVGEQVEIVGGASTFSLTVSGTHGGGLSVDEDNLILRGARCLAQEIGASAVSFHLTKTAPVASGIGAGTSDGAAAMALLNAREGYPLSAEHLMRLAVVLGADGPLCMARQLFDGTLFRAQGVGETVTPGPSVAPFSICLANPGVSISTPSVFGFFDQKGMSEANSPFLLAPPDRGLSPQGLARWARTHRNDLAAPARSLSPEIAKTEDTMRARSGVQYARMSGSGATVFGLFADRPSAMRAAQWFRAQGYWSVSGEALSRAVVGAAP